ncbi:MAG: hypothetical protein WC575_02660 [Patescibacteria group bacterium]
MAKELEFDPTMGSFEDHLKVLEQRISSVEAELEAAKTNNNAELITEAEERLVKLNEEKENFIKQNQAA